MRPTFRPFATAGVLLFALGFVLVYQPASPAQDKDRPHAGTKWEYKQVGSPAIRDDELNKLGEEGWELAAVYRDQVQSPINRFVFKRPRR